jgi:hypothetical protein
MIQRLKPELWIRIAIKIPDPAFYLNADPNPGQTLNFYPDSSRSTAMIKTTIFVSFKSTLMSVTNHALPFKFVPTFPPPPAHETGCGSRSGVCRIRNFPSGPDFYFPNRTYKCCLVKGTTLAPIFTKML